MGWWFGRNPDLEVIADEQPPEVGTILTDAARGAIACNAEQPLGGYAAYGPSIKAALQPIISGYGVELFDDGFLVRSAPVAISEVIDDAELGNSSDGQPVPRIQREQAPARALPAALRLSYYDPARDYQSGEARANVSDFGGNEELTELPAVIDAAGAKSLVEQDLARRWAARDKLTLRLPPRYLALEPGSRLKLSLRPER